MVDEKQLADIKVRAEKASPGPWEIYRLPSNPDEYYLRSTPVPLPEDVQFNHQFIETLHVPHPEDMQFIEAAREDVPALVAALEEAQREWTNEAELWVLEVQKAQARGDALQQQLDAAKALHNNGPDHTGDDGWCLECGHSWPCQTARALSVAVVSPATEPKGGQQ